MKHCAKVFFHWTLSISLTMLSMVAIPGASYPVFVLLQGCHILEKITEFHANPWIPWKVFDFQSEFWKIIEKSLKSLKFPFCVIRHAPMSHDLILKVSWNFGVRISWQLWYIAYWVFHSFVVDSHIVAIADEDGGILTLNTDTTGFHAILEGN